jgi:hypothetical protein
MLPRMMRKSSSSDQKKLCPAFAVNHSNVSDLASFNSSDVNPGMGQNRSDGAFGTLLRRVSWRKAGRLPQSRPERLG